MNTIRPGLTRQPPLDIAEGSFVCLLSIATVLNHLIQRAAGLRLFTGVIQHIFQNITERYKIS